MFLGDKVRSCSVRSSTVLPGAGSFNPPVDGQIQVVGCFFGVVLSIIIHPSGAGSDIYYIISFLLRVKIAVFLWSST